MSVFYIRHIKRNGPIARNIKLKENSKEKDSTLVTHRETEDQT